MKTTNNVKKTNSGDLMDWLADNQKKVKSVKKTTSTTSKQEKLLKELRADAKKGVWF